MREVFSRIVDLRKPLRRWQSSKLEKIFYSKPVGVAGAGGPLGMGGKKGLDMPASDISKASAPHAGAEFHESPHFLCLAAAILFAAVADIPQYRRLYFIEDAHFALPR